MTIAATATAPPTADAQAHFDREEAQTCRQMLARLKQAVVNQRGAEKDRRKTLVKGRKDRKKRETALDRFETAEGPTLEGVDYLARLKTLFVAVDEVLAAEAERRWRTGPPRPIASVPNWNSARPWEFPRRRRRSSTGAAAALGSGVPTVGSRGRPPLPGVRLHGHRLPAML